MAAGIKQIENRGRLVIHPRYFGEPFALHATAEISNDATRRILEIAPELCTDPDQLWWRLGSITSAIIAIATVERVFRGPDRSVLGAQARWYFGPLGYVLRDVRVLPEPVKCGGHQWFWELPAVIEDQVRYQLARAA